MNILYKRIFDLCKLRGITGYRVCKDTGLTPSILTDLKMGRKRSLSAENINKIANYFDVSVGYLLGTERENSFSEDISQGKNEDRGKYEEEEKVKKPLPNEREMNWIDRIQQLCKEKGVTEQQAESDLGVSASYISKFDKSEPTATKLYNMSKYFGVTMEYIYAGEGEKSPPPESRDGLSEEETRLIAAYNDLNEEGREKVFDYVDTLVQSGKYIKN